MPEGDTIFRAAQRLRAVMVGRRILAATHRNPHVAVDQLPGCLVQSIEARGKHLLMTTQSDWVIHSHMGMTGSWHYYGPQEPWRKPRYYAELILEMSEPLDAASPITAGAGQPFTVVCFTPKLLQLLTVTEIKRHRWLGKLGPDILADDFSMPQVLERASLVLRPTTIGEAIMNQTIVCGIGNVYKSETLFVCRQNPFQALASIDEGRLTAILETAAQLMKRNLGGYPRRTRDRLGGDRLWVYRRTGKPCYRCAQTIRMRRQGDLGRSTYWCPDCQRAAT